MTPKEYYLAVREGVNQARIIYESEHGTIRSREILINNLDKGLTSLIKDKNSSIGSVKWDESQNDWAWK